MLEDIIAFKLIIYILLIINYFYFLHKHIHKRFNLIVKSLVSLNW